MASNSPAGAATAGDADRKPVLFTAEKSSNIISRLFFIWIFPLISYVPAFACFSGRRSGGSSSVNAWFAWWLKVCTSLIKHFLVGKRAAHEQVALTHDVCLPVCCRSLARRRGYAGPLQESDLGSLMEADRSAMAYADFKRQWEQEQRSAKPSLVRAFRKVYGGAIFRAGLLKGLQDAIAILQPFILRMLIIYLQERSGSKPPPASRGYILCAVLLLSFVVFTLCFNHHLLGMQRVGLRFRAAASAAIFRKSLSLSAKALTDMSSGEVVNLLATDTERVYGVFEQLHLVWAGPVTIVVVMIMLIVLLGWAAVVGIAALFITIPLQGWFAKGTAKYSGLVMIEAGKRLKLLNEIITGVRVVKYFAWENSFLERVAVARARELKFVKTSQVFRAGISFMMAFAPTLVTLVTFLTYGGLGHAMNPAVVFPAVSLFNVMRFPMGMLPALIPGLIDAKISLQRMQKMLLLEEKVPVKSSAQAAPAVADAEAEDSATGAARAKKKKSSSKKTQEAALADVPPGIRIANGTYSWGVPVKPKAAGAKPGGPPAGAGAGAKPEPKKKKKAKKGAKTPDGAIELKAVAGPEPKHLENINFVANAGELVMVVGHVGSGKSSLLAAILGEIGSRAGTVTVDGSLAYASQEAWIKNATVRDNILFGAPFDAERYEAVLDACSLRDDLAILRAGDMTEIGERGINLSYVLVLA